MVSSGLYIKKFVCLPGQIDPEFKRGVTDYKITVGALEQTITLDVTLMSPMDSYDILQNNQSISNVINMKEGEMINVQIAVTNDDEYKVSRLYNFEIEKLYPHSAFLNYLGVHQGRIVPCYDRKIENYTCILGSCIRNVKLYCNPPDTKCQVTVNDVKVQSSYELNLGRTVFHIKVKSVNKVKTKTYTLSIMKKMGPRYILIKNPMDRFRYEDPIFLSPLVCPTTVNNYEIWNHASYETLEQLSRQAKMQYGKRVFEERSIEMIPNLDTEKNVSNCIGRIVLTYGGYTSEFTLSKLNSLLPKCSEVSPFKSLTFSCSPVTIENMQWNPDWQQQYIKNKPQQKYSLDEFIRKLQIYYFAMPTERLQKDAPTETVEDPAHLLYDLLLTAVVGLQNDQDNYKLHKKIGYILEELFLINDIYGYSCDSEVVEEAAVSENEMKIQSICKKYGFTKKVSLSQQLCALELENTALLKQNLILEASAVEELIEWKAKQADMEGKMAFLVSEPTNFLGQATIKYKTALSIKPKSSNNQYQVGRMFILEGNYTKAIMHLESALTLKPNNDSYKALLGFAQSRLVVTLSEQKLDKTIEMLLDTMEIALVEFSEDSSQLESIAIHRNQTETFICENFFRLTNPLVCLCVFSLARLIDKRPKYNTYIKPLYVYHTALHLASLGWSQVSRGYIMSQFEYVMIQCHYILLTRIKEEGLLDIPTEIYIRRNEWLHALIASSVLEPTEQLLKIHEEVCRYLVFSQPCNSFYLVNLGIVTLNMAQSYPTTDYMFKKNMHMAMRFFKNSIELNGRPLFGRPSVYLTNASWFQDHQNAFLTKKAPRLILESLNLVKNDPPGTLFLPFGFRMRKNNLSPLPPKDNNILPSSHERSVRGNKCYKKSGEMKISQKDTPGRPKKSAVSSFSKQINPNRELKKRTKDHSLITNIDKKVHHGNKLSICNDPNIQYWIYRSKEDRNGSPSSDFARSFKSGDGNSRHHINILGRASNLTGIFYLSQGINPISNYGRLMLAKAFRLKDDIVNAIRCYNIIRKRLIDPFVKMCMTEETIEILSKYSSYGEVIDYVGKIRIDSKRPTEGDIQICKEIVAIFIKIGEFNDERLCYFSKVILDHRGEEILLEIFKKHEQLDNYHKLRNWCIFKYTDRLRGRSDSEDTNEFD